MEICLHTRQRAYPIVALILFLLSAVMLVRLEAHTLGVLGLLCLPVLAVASRFESVQFDGSQLQLKGPVTFFISLVTGQTRSILIHEIEMIATESTRLRYRPDRIRYRYRTLVVGNNWEVGLHSSEPGYTTLVKALFHTVGESKLDPRSSELLHYLDSTPDLSDYDLPQDYLAQLPTHLLRGIANSLRLAGRMRQALNCFTMAYQREPNNPHLLYEMGRFLRSLAAYEDPRLNTRSSACLRLAARMSRNEPHLLERIGETYFERLEYERASKCFTRALELDPNLFRAHVGLAEIALRSGKLAHVAHFYSTAAQSSADTAQIRLAQREADYYERLCSDEDYLEAEVSRITILRHLRWARTASATVFLISLTVVSLAGSLLASFESLGWSITASSGIVWVGTTVGFQLFSKRLDFTLFASQD